MLKKEGFISSFEKFISELITKNGGEFSFYWKSLRAGRTAVSQRDALNWIPTLSWEWEPESLNRLFECQDSMKFDAVEDIISGRTFPDSLPFDAIQRIELLKGHE